MTNRRTRRATPALRTGLLTGLALLLLLGVSCGPGGESAPPQQGGIEVRMVVDGPGRLLVDGYDCADGCPVQVDSSTEVTFEAVPAAGNVLVAWGGACEPLAPTCTGTFQEGDEVRATFAPHALRIDMTGDGVGTIEIAGPTVNTTCSGDCGIAFSEPLNHLVTIDVSGRTELGAWVGACDSADQPHYCYVIPTGATDIGKTWTHPPLATDDEYTAPDSGALVVDADDGVLANDDDTPNDVLTAVVAAGPSHGTLDLASDGGFTYTPDDNYLGSDTFSYTVRDAFDSEDGADVTITIGATNRAPVATLDRYETDRNTGLTIAAPGVLANDSDPDGDALTATLVDDVQTGALTLRPDGGFDYEPPRGFAGNARFTYRATDGDLSSDVTTVTIAVAAANRAPIAEPDAYERRRDEILDIDAANGVLANDEDLDGDPLEAILIDDVPDGEGDLELLADGSFTYDPDGYLGATEFTYQASDGEDRSAPATVTIDVINAAPTAADDPADDESYEAERNEELEVDAPGLLENDTDPDGDDLTAVIDTQPANGSATVNADGSFTYTPADGYAGPDSFTYVASDGDLDSDPATVSIWVEGDDDDDDDD